MRLRFLGRCALGNFAKVHCTLALLRGRRRCQRHSSGQLGQLGQLADAELERREDSNVGVVGGLGCSWLGARRSAEPTHADDADAIQRGRPDHPKELYPLLARFGGALVGWPARTVAVGPDGQLLQLLVGQQSSAYSARQREQSRVFAVDGSRGRRPRALPDDGGTDSASEEVVASFGNSAALLAETCKVRQARPAGDDRAGERKRRRTGQAWHDLVWRVDPSAAPELAQASLVSFPSPDVAVAQVAVDEALPSASGEGQALPAASGTLVSIDAPVPAKHLFLLEGTEVREEKHGVMGGINAYHRLRVDCPHHKGAKPPCRMSRAFDTRGGRSAGLGDMEPYAFLGAWLCRHSEFASAQEHKAYKPSSADVKAYALAHGWSANAAASSS